MRACAGLRPQGGTLARPGRNPGSEDTAPPTAHQQRRAREIRRRRGVRHPAPKE